MTTYGLHFGQLTMSRLPIAQNHLERCDPLWGLALCSANRSLVVLRIGQRHSHGSSRHASALISNLFAVLTGMASAVRFTYGWYVLLGHCRMIPSLKNDFAGLVSLRGYWIQ